MSRIQTPIIRPAFKAPIGPGLRPTQFTVQDFINFFKPTRPLTFEEAIGAPQGSLKSLGPAIESFFASKPAARTQPGDIFTWISSKIRTSTPIEGLPPARPPALSRIPTKMEENLARGNIAPSFRMPRLPSATKIIVGGAVAAVPITTGLLVSTKTGGEIVEETQEWRKTLEPLTKPFSNPLIMAMLILLGLFLVMRK